MYACNRLQHVLIALHIVLIAMLAFPHNDAVIMCNFAVFDAKDPMRRKFVVRMRCAFTPSVRSITRCSNFKVCARCEREGGGERGKEGERGKGGGKRETDSE